MARARAEYEITATDKTAAAFRRVQGNLDKTAKALGALRGGLAGLGATIGVGGLSAFTAGALAASDRLGKLADRLGVSTEFLSEMRFVAQQSGVEFDTFAASLQRMIRRVGEAALGTGEAVGALKELGLEAEALRERGPEKAFLEITKALSRVKDPLDRVRLAQKLFDSEGVRLLQITNQGAEGINRLRKRARELGATLTRDQAEGAARAQDAMGELSTATGGLGQTLSSKLAPGIERAAGSMAEFVAQLNAAIQTTDTLAAALGSLGTAGLGKGLAALEDFLRLAGGFLGPAGLLPRNAADLLGAARRGVGALTAPAPSAPSPITIGPGPGGGRLVTGGLQPGQKSPEFDVLTRISIGVIETKEVIEQFLRRLVTDTGAARAG